MKFTTSAAYRAKYTRKNEPNHDKLPKLCDFVTAIATNTTQDSTNEDGWTSVRTRRNKSKATLNLTPKAPVVSVAGPKKIAFPSLGGNSCTGKTAAPKKAYLTGWSKVAATSKTDFIATEKEELDAMKKEVELLRTQIMEAKAKTPKVDVKKEVKEIKSDYFFTDFDDGMAWGDIVDDELGMM